MKLLLQQEERVPVRVNLRADQPFKITDLQKQDIQYNKEQRRKQAQRQANKVYIDKVLRALDNSKDAPNDDERFWSVFQYLVPDRGAAETLAGELIRAIGRLCRRDLNDGDKFFAGYGLETCASAAAFILETIDSKQLYKLFVLASKQYNNDDKYTNCLNEIAKFILEELQTNIEKYAVKNTKDMLDTDISIIEDKFMQIETLELSKQDFDVEMSDKQFDDLVENLIYGWGWNTARIADQYSDRAIIEAQIDEIEEIYRKWNQMIREFEEEHYEDDDQEQENK